MLVVCVPKHNRPLSFGERVRARRSHLGLTQGEVAESAGITFQFLSKLERGALENPTLKTMEAIAEALDTTLAELLSDLPAGRGGDAAGE